MLEKICDMIYESRMLCGAEVWGMGDRGRGAGEVCTRRLMRIHRNTMNGAAESELRRDSSAATRYQIMFKWSPKEESAIQCYSGRLDSSGQSAGHDN
jgi:hypothetical protein